MQFNNQDDRIDAIKKACEKLGKIYGDMKFQEHMLVEFKQSFVPNSIVTVAVTPVPVKAKASKVKVEAPVTVEEAKVEAPVIVEEVKVEAPAPTSDCPINTASELRDVMLRRFNESGRTADAQMALRNAMFEATGSEKVLEVKPDLIAAGYNAIMSVEI